MSTRARSARPRPASKAGPGAGGRRIIVLAILLVLLAGVAAWTYRAPLLRAIYEGRPPDQLLADARANPGDVVLVKAAGTRLCALGRGGQAADLLASAAAAHPEDTEVAVLSARASLQAGDPASAEKLLRDTAERAPGSPEVLFWLGEVLAARGLHGPAVQLWQEVVGIAPSHGGAWAKLGESHFDSGDYQAAAHALGRAARAGQRGKVNVLLALALLRLGRDVEAEAAARKAVAEGGGAPALVALGQALQAAPGEGRAREALETFRQASALQPEDPNTLMLLATAARSVGEHREAVRALRRHLRVPGVGPAGYLLLAQSYRALQEPARAEDALRVYRRLEPVDTRVQIARFRARAAPDDPRLQLELARELLDAGRKQEAFEVLRPLRSHPRLGDDAAGLEERAKWLPLFPPPELPTDPAGDDP